MKFFIILLKLYLNDNLDLKNQFDLFNAMDILMIAGRDLTQKRGFKTNHQLC
jgi:hypothetical protein